ncbi:MAG: TldD/PmbA family protein [Candidatus Krumholzibacteriota bacterium]|nr:TldD/PmbA family protein [Candidatus Krumholzibacteriota bacterium]
MECVLTSIRKDLLKESTNYILDLASVRSVQCDVYVEDSAGIEIETHRGNVESVDKYRERGIAIRLVKDAGAGYAFTSDLSFSSLDSMFEEALVIARNSTPLDEDILADPQPSEADGNLDQDDLSRDAVEGRIEDVIKMEEAAFDFSGSIVNTDRAGYFEESSIITVSSSRGFTREEKRGSCSTFISAISKRSGETRSGWAWGQSPSPDGIDFAGIGRKAAERSLNLLGSRKIPGGRYPTLFSQLAFIDILGFLGDILSAEMVIKGISCLSGKLNKMIAPKFLSIVDDPFLKGGCFNSRFDDEGVSRRRYEIIKSGRLKGYLHTVMTSRKMKVTSAGNAFRSSFKAVPGPGVTNFYIEPGDKSSRDIMSGLSEGIYVQSIMGIHTADSISGDFSVGISGSYIKSGNVHCPICEMTVSGNILDVLSGITCIANDLVFAGSSGSPSILVSGLSVSGK